MSNQNGKWYFPLSDGGEWRGISDAGIETFNGERIKSLAREICQNSLDARLNPEEPAKVEFQLFTIKPEEIPGYSAVKESLNLSLEYWKENLRESTGEESDKTVEFFQKALNEINRDKITCLRISDFNTTGLTGSNNPRNTSTAWSNLIKSSGVSGKTGSNAGSFGIGKYAPFSCSSFRTVFYSTVDKEGIQASQGVARLTSFINSNNEATQGIGYYGLNKNEPIRDQFSVDKNFIRPENSPGTDIFILGFPAPENWEAEMILSILDGFFYAIHNQDLTVTVNNIEIKKETLPDCISDFVLKLKKKDRKKRFVHEYYDSLTNKNSFYFERDLQKDLAIEGKLKLWLILKDYSRKVAMVREVGMKILDKGGLNGVINFSGVLFIEGAQINSFLRNLENPTHTEWEVDRNKGKKAESNKVLAYLRAFIIESLNSIREDIGQDKSDPLAGRFLPISPADDPLSNKDINGSDDTISELVLIEPKRKSAKSNKVTQTEEETDYIDFQPSETPGGGQGTSGKGGKSKGKGHGHGGGENPGNGGGETVDEINSSIVFVHPLKIRSFSTNKNEGRYRLIFTPRISAAKGSLKIKKAAESGSYEARILEAGCPDQPDIKVEDNKITNIAFEKNKPVCFDVRIDSHDFCSLEVEAYGIKK